MSGFPSIIDLSSFLFSINEGFKVQGDAAGDNLGLSVSNAGDVNGDGYDDFIIGAPGNGFGGTNAGQAYVIFGQAGGAAGLSDIDLSSLTSAQGFTITGDTVGDQAGYSVSSAGDINGDGFDDVLVGAPFGDNGGSSAGEAYLIYGKASGFSNIDLTSFTAADGLIFQGLAAGDDTGWALSSAGDINGDGLDDVLIGVRDADRTGASDAGKVYVYFGSTTYTSSSGGSPVVVLDDTDPNQVANGISFSITGASTSDNLGWAVSSAGDVNGDGYVDIIVGAPNADNSGSETGEAYVIFGKASGFSNIDLSSFSAADGFTIQGDAADDDAGVSVASAGDINADGIDDLIISSRYGDNGGVDAGQAYVLFGKASGLGDIDLSTFGLIDGFTIQGAAANDFAGWSVAGGADFNGDGYDDVIIGALLNDDGGISAGAAYVIFGKGSGFADIDLSSLSSSDGFVIQGAAADDLAGASVSSAGDTNGDGYDDILVGAYRSDSAHLDAGEAYVILGRPDPGQDFPFRIDLSTVSAVGGFTLQGDAAFDSAGGDVSTLGDINGDGFDDFIIGADGDDSGGNLAGAAYVLFGQSSGLTDIDLAALTPADGFKVQGDLALDTLGVDVSSAGDINGDGFDDILIGSPFDEANGSFGGAAYVIFGKATAFADIDISALTIQDGFAITGENSGDMIGTAISSAGDINGDGFDDILVSTPNARNDDIFDDDFGEFAGASYLIYGKADGFSDVDLFNLSASDGIIIRGTASYESAGISISSAGDVNGDGFDDFIIGAQDQNNLGDFAKAYVIFGSSLGPANIDLNTLSSSEGFDVTNILSSNFEGPAVASLGDINGDGFDDIAIGAIGNAAYAFNNSGQVHVIFGKANGFSTLDVTSLAASDGFVVQGENISDQLGSDVSAAGDVNGDGFDDFIISAPQNDIAGSNSGSAYLIYGKASGLVDIDLNLLTAEDGFIIEADKADDGLGAVSGAGDVNGDGFDDLLIGARFNDNGNFNAGAAYIIFGRGPEIAVNRDGSAADQTILGSNLNDTLQGFGGDDILLGRNGGDTIYGGSGNDILAGASGFDALYGDSGDDSFFVLGSFGDSDSVDGGTGIDTLYLASSDNDGNLLAASSVDWEVNLDTGSGTTVGLFFNASVTLLNVENIVGGDGDDVLTGDGFNNVFEGGAGIDTLLGGDGDDSLTGGAGSDILIGGDGNDMIFAYTADNFVNVTGGGGVDALHLLSETAVGYDFAANSFEAAEVRNLADTLIQRFTTAGNGDTELTTYDIDDSQSWSYNVVRTDVSGTKSYSFLAVFYLDGSDALDVTISDLDNGNRVTTDYDPDDTEDFGLSIFTEDINNDELFTSVLQLRNDAGEVTRFVNIYDNDLEVTIDFEFSTVGTVAEGLFDINDDADWFRKVVNADNSAGGTLLNYQSAEIFQTQAFDNYGSIVIDDDGVRILTDNDLDGSDSWATQITKTDDDDSFSWSTIVDQRDASGNILYLSQTNEGSYDTIDVFDVAGAEVWARTVTFVDDEGDFSWSTLTFFYDDMGIIYDTVEVPDGM